MDTTTLHTYEFNYYTGDEWEECSLYTSVRDDDRVIREFLDQQRDMKIPTESYYVEYKGEGPDNCDMDYQGGLSTRCF